MKRLVIFLIALALILPLAYSLSASIGNAKVVLRVNASPEEPAILKRTILVNNKNDIPVNITLTPAEEFEKFVDIKDKQFTLQPGESKKAEFTLTIDRGGTIEGRIIVQFSPADAETKENSVGLASTILIISEGPIIEEPEEKIEPEENLTTVEKKLESADNATNEQPEAENFDETEKPATAARQDTTEPKKEYGPNPVIGILIMVVIVAIGVGLFFVVSKLIKSK